MSKHNNVGQPAAPIPGNGSYVNAGPDLEPKKPTPYLYDAPTNAPHVGNHSNGVGGPCDRNNNGIDDSRE